MTNCVQRLALVAAFLVGVSGVRSPASDNSRGRSATDLRQTGASFHLSLSNFGGVFLVPTAGIRPLIPEALTPVEAAPGVSYVLAYCAHIVATGPATASLHPARPLTYNEFALLLPVLDLYGDPVQAFTVPVIAVDSALARAIGQGVSAFPKFLAHIDIVASDSGFVCTVSADGENVATLSAGLTPIGPPTPRSLRYYNARRSGILVVSQTTDEIAVGGQVNVPGGATLVLGDHPSVAAFEGAGIQSSSVLNFYFPSDEQNLTLLK